jgi:tetratricopeptide (TPR) repeat protein
MGRIEKTVFICYRRTNVPWALAIFQNLTNYGYDAFFDFQGIASGDFERVILENVRARAHFLVLLTPSALERCGDRGDWLRREIETAMEFRRNIVPLMLDNFDFGAPSTVSQLTGALTALKHYNAPRVPADYFLEAMGRLRDKFLNVPLESVSHPDSLSAPARQAAVAQQAAASAAPAVGQEELTAQGWFEKGFDAADPDEKIRCYTEAIRLKPDSVEAYNNRGSARADKGDLDGALKDYTEALRLKPDDADTYYKRGVTRVDTGDPTSAKAAIADFQKYLDLGGGIRDGDQAEVEQFIRDLKNKL